MKKILFLLLFITMSISAQSIRVYNMSVAPQDQSAVGDLFEEYFGSGKRKSGNVTLQRVNFLNGVSHRVIMTGDPNNWGSTIDRPDSDWAAFTRGLNHYRERADGSYTASSAYWKNGDREKYNYGQQWLIKVKEPKKYAAAWVKFAKAIEPMIGDRMMGLGALSMGDVDGASHYTVFYGQSLNDLDIILNKIKNSEAYKEFSKSRGENVIIKSFAVQDLLSFN